LIALYNFKIQSAAFITFAKIKLLIEITMNRTGIILCGGQSKRMGVNKGLLKLGDLTITEHVINALNPICGEIILSVNNQDFDFLPYRKVIDKIHGKGPISGFYSSLSESNTDENIIISCDTPFITDYFLNLLLSNSNGFEIVLPVYNSWVQAMTGYFKKSILPVIQSQMRKGNFVPINIFEKCNINLLQVNNKNCKDADKIFFNINSQEDYQKAIKLFKEGINR
jgi:molybdenum cofactor guanylyltransferase